MKRKIVVIVTLIILILVTYSFWVTFPKQHDKTLQGIYYQLGNEEEIYEVTMHIEGEIRRSLFGEKTFEGVLDIEDEELAVPKGERNVTIKFDGDGRGDIVYSGIRNGSPYTHGYGSIFVNHNFTEVTILKGSWNAKEGYMITAPAKTYFEALTISNELMGEFLKVPL
ncbi:hypothetical protein QWT69_12140 [Sporosarcina oncorhynchi]|uniref:Uncharacterized protein n=1 Tax=Sporosarcina oncorhynchi TaxID=3056444 RepID=A0ABZ0L1X7_9BACL|nr:hypothetical protein [Sporosarcina sp. T2O-4]WOV86631.1 hypothetical protein QWT69_12140 [Sporosarcina sp. T2O-4]